MPPPPQLASIALAILVASCTAAPAAKDIAMTDAARFANPAGIAPPVGAYSHVARVRANSDLLFLAGQVGLALDGSLPADVDGQYAQALRNVAALVTAEGGSMRDVVRLNTYLVRPLDADAARATRAAVLGDARPAMTLLYVARLADEKYLVEVEATAALPPRGR